MRAITQQQPGGPQELHLSEVPTPEPGPGQIRIRVHTAGVNRAAILQRQGFYPPPKGVTDILGLEVAGLVDAVGVGTESPYRPGDPVVGLLAGGGYAEFVVVEPSHCAPIPESLDFIQAGAIMETAATVVSNFDQLGLTSGQTILIHGGAGGVGSFAIPYAKQLGLTVITTVGSPDKARYAATMGADHAINYHDDWVSEVNQATQGGGVDAILDIIGAKYLEQNISVMARDGSMVVIGLQGGTKATLDLSKLLAKSATITATSLRFRPAAEKSQIVSQVIERVWPLFTCGAIPIPPITSFELAEASAAHQRLQSGENTGKIVLTVSTGSAD